MPVQNVECQIARLQIGRFLKGEVLPPDMMAQLEAHIGRCPECREELAGRKAELLAMATGRRSDETTPASSKPRTPRETKPKATPRKKEPSEAPRKAAVATPPAAAAFPWKTLGYSLALAGVLLAMSFVAKDPTALLGPRLEPSSQPAAAEPEAPARTTPQRAAVTANQAAAFPTIYVPSMDEPIDREALQQPEPSTASNEQAPAPEAQADRPPAEQVSQPQPAPAPRPQAAAKPRTVSEAPRSARRPTPRRTNSAAPRQAPSLRIYDEQGRPIQP
ncbi:MAG: zf-HC2 domain-containing protein [Fimbriimonadales bacterium]